MTGAQHPTSPAGDGLAAVRARAAELGLSVSEYVRDQLRRTRGEEAWERALAQAGEMTPARPRTVADLRAAIHAVSLPPLADKLADDIESAVEMLTPGTGPRQDRD